MSLKVNVGVSRKLTENYNSTCPFRRPCREWQADQTLPPAEDRTPLPILEDEIGAD